MTAPRHLIAPSELAELGAFDDAPSWTEQGRDRAVELFEFHHEWTADQVRAGVDGPVPAGRPPGSDFNQHVPDVNADGAAEDVFHARARQIMGLPG